MFGSEWEAAVCASGLQFRRVRTYAVGAMVCYVIRLIADHGTSEPIVILYLEGHVVTRVKITKAVRL